jgi:hypothetical protein
MLAVRGYIEPMSNIKTPLFGAVLATIAITAAFAQTGGETVNALSMSISQDESAIGPDKAMHFIVVFRNISNEDFAIVPGELVDCQGKAAKNRFIVLNLVDSKGKSHRLDFLGDGPPYAAGCAGNIKSFVVVLHEGATFDMPVDLGKYLDLSNSKQYDQTRYHPGTYSLQAEFTGTSPLLTSSPSPIKVWKGTVSSNILQIHFDQEFAGP